MKKYYFIPFLFTVILSCQDITVGYLSIENASYTVDSLVVKKELDITPPYETSNPQYYELLEWGYTPEQLANMGIYPTILVGGGEDYERNERNIPWVSTSIEGVEGTQPILVSIKEIKVIDGNQQDDLEKNISVRGDGTFTVPLHNTLSKGRYVISLNFRNEGYSKDLDNCFTIIVK